VKRFPNCGSAHRAMDGLLALKAEHGFTADDVEAIHVRAPVTHLNNLMYTAPEDALQAKFSLEYGLACCLVTGDCGLTDFSDRSRRAARTCARST
jgi:2-methylcitrate dehydratase PrpD